jgi:chemotaxis protein MotB
VTQSKDVRAAVAGYFRDPGVFQYEKSTGILAPGGKPGIEPGAPSAESAKAAAAGAAAMERQRLLQTAENIKSQLAKVPDFAALRDQIEVTVTSEGLRIELVDRSGSSFFDSGSAALLGSSERILTIIAGQLGQLTNDVVIEGHTDSRQYANGDRYGNWELSADRANAARRVMEHSGLRPGQVRAIRGLADTQLHIQGEPLDPRNRRVSIIVRSQAAKALDAAYAALNKDRP